MMPNSTPIAVRMIASIRNCRRVYDNLDRLVKVIDGQGNVATYNYDAVWNLLSLMWNAKNH